MELDKELESLLKQKGYKKVECPKEQKESKAYKGMMKAIEEYKKNPVTYTHEQVAQLLELE